jgi:hypothetical protein
MDMWEIIGLETFSNKSKVETFEPVTIFAKLPSVWTVLRPRVSSGTANGNFAMSDKMLLKMVIFNHDGSTDEFVVTNFNSGGFMDEDFMAGVEKMNLADITILMDNAASRKEMVFGYAPNNITYRFQAAFDEDLKFRAMTLFAFRYQGANAELREVLTMGSISITMTSRKWLSKKFPSSSGPIDAIRITWETEAQRALHIPVRFEKSS